MDLDASLIHALDDETDTYLYGAGRIAKYGTKGVEYYPRDALGCVWQMMKANGNVTLGPMSNHILRHLGQYR